MFMRYRGGGVGHQATRCWDDVLLQAEGAAPTEDEVVDETTLGFIVAEGSGGRNGSEEDNNEDEDNKGDDEDGEEESALHVGEAAAEANDEEEIDVIERDPEDTHVHDEDVLAEENYGAL